MVFIETGKMGGNRCQRDDEVFGFKFAKFKNVKFENPVRHQVQVSEDNFGCSNLELKGENRNL